MPHALCNMIKTVEVSFRVFVTSGRGGVRRPRGARAANQTGRRRETQARERHR